MVIFSQGGRRCDERCYNAKWSACRCVCGGKNHGKGLGHAINHNTLSGKSLIEFATDEMRQDAIEKRDLGIYGEATSEQAEGLRYESEHEEHKSVKNALALGVGSSTRKKHDEMFKIHGTKSGRLDNTRQNKSAMTKTFKRNFDGPNQ